MKEEATPKVDYEEVKNVSVKFDVYEDTGPVEKTPIRPTTCPKEDQENSPYFLTAGLPIKRPEISYRGSPLLERHMSPRFSIAPRVSPSISGTPKMPESPRIPINEIMIDSTPSKGQFEVYEDTTTQNLAHEIKRLDAKIQQFTTTSHSTTSTLQETSKMASSNVPNDCNSGQFEIYEDTTTQNLAYEMKRLDTKTQQVTNNQSTTSLLQENSSTNNRDEGHFEVYKDTTTQNLAYEMKRLETKAQSMTNHSTTPISTTTNKLFCGSTPAKAHFEVYEDTTTQNLAYEMQRLETNSNANNYTTPILQENSTQGKFDVYEDTTTQNIAYEIKRLGCKQDRTTNKEENKENKKDDVNQKIIEDLSKNELKPKQEFKSTSSVIVRRVFIPSSSKKDKI